MGVTYELADEKTAELVKRAMVLYHQRPVNNLVANLVTVQAIFARDVDADGVMSPAIKIRGYPAAAKIQVTSLEDRARGMADAKLTIDDYVWQGLPESRRLALLDHELEHLEIVMRTTKTGIMVARDDLGRTKLKIKPHDFELGFFASVAERHGEAAIEVREVQRFHETYGQFCLFPMAGTKTETEQVRTEVTITDGDGDTVTTDLETLRRATENAHLRGRVGPDDERDPAVVAAQTAMESES